MVLNLQCYPRFSVVYSGSLCPSLHMSAGWPMMEVKFPESDVWTPQLRDHLSAGGVEENWRHPQNQNSAKKFRVSIRHREVESRSHPNDKMFCNALHQKQ